MYHILSSLFILSHFSNFSRTPTLPHPSTDDARRHISRLTNAATSSRLLNFPADQLAVGPYWPESLKHTILSTLVTSELAAISSLPPFQMFNPKCLIPPEAAYLETER